MSAGGSGSGSGSGGGIGAAAAGGGCGGVNMLMNRAIEETGHANASYHGESAKLELRSASAAAARRCEDGTGPQANFETARSFWLGYYITLYISFSP